MLLFILIFLGFFGYQSASVDSGFLDATDIILTQPDEAAAYVEARLGKPLPPGTIVNGVFEGGFQDAYVQIRMTLPEAAIPDLYAALNVDPTSLYRIAPNPFPSDQTWWDIQSHEAVWRADATFGSFDTTAISMVPDPANSGQVLIYLTASDI